jgi:hypothetical protein
MWTGDQNSVDVPSLGVFGLTVACVEQALAPTSSVVSDLWASCAAATRNRAAGYRLAAGWLLFVCH